jgi:hypothetical protein
MRLIANKDFMRKVPPRPISRLHTQPSWQLRGNTWTRMGAGQQSLLREARGGTPTVSFASSKGGAGKSTWGRFRIRVKSGHKPKLGGVREGLPSRTVEAVFYLIENTRFSNNPRRSHFRTPGRTVGSQGRWWAFGGHGPIAQFIVIKRVFV